MKKITLLFFIVFTSIISLANAQQSVAREWNEVLLDAVRSDFARPTVHARNLFHSSVLMYDAWAIFDSQAETVFLGKTFNGYNCVFNGISTPSDTDAATHEVISYAMLRLLKHRFANSPGNAEITIEIDDLFSSYGYNDAITSEDYSTGSYAALGNYLAAQMIAFGLDDNSFEQFGYPNSYYTPENDPLILELYQDNTGINPNKWQPLAFDMFVDQSGHIFPSETPAFLSPEWGTVKPFCLVPEDLDVLNDGFDCYVYNDPGPPAYIQNSNEDGIDDPYKWNFALVASWSSHLDPTDPTMIDISPGAIGNFDLVNFPETFEEYKTFYDFTNGGDASTGHALNPSTGLAYAPNMVKRSDYARVLAEFWADGPDSETPPGHWFTLMNYVSDHPDVVKKIGGVGSTLDDLEWDVKCYLALGGAMHDSAVNIWGIKGYYDYIRPISAIRYMAGKGQSSDAMLPNYDPHGMPLIPGLIEQVQSGEELAGAGDENVGKIKIFAWRGPDFINDPETDVAGVDWILGEHWWPYQRGTFVTPPFAGYLSGHSAFSRAASEVLTRLTGDPFFPGGMGTFDLVQNDFLVFEVGPTENMTLQWATYRDASDQTSLSRIWGGIHPPIDDIRGRIIGDKIGNDAFDFALGFFEGTLSNSTVAIEDAISLYPIPFKDELVISNLGNKPLRVELYSLDGKRVYLSDVFQNSTQLQLSSLVSGLYFAKFIDSNNSTVFVKKVVKN
ncbi:T9SS type A sorting domain-containing protein [Psychroserpens ponticola]|uniref:T9SS type A sorting domain-containing protein n=1 Tax=Psychroserpens ponticola TaxID=2932268 RepID=A0ABY7S427_9FLAO|nr:T9SS type A sorting domain-containing protein [Psychroserpens ponticola]WCO03196.1 T9SS type A sorting domain-containing protein [Psychroserpens ponticola]